MQLPPHQEPDGTETGVLDQIELLTFAVGEQDYAIDIMCVREIRNWTEPTPLPKTPDFVRGVINLRGTVLPILDLAKRLELDAGAPDERSVFVVIHAEGRVFGVTVDGVSDILTVPRSMLQDPPALDDGTEPGCVSALILEEERMIRVLAASRIAPHVTGAGKETAAA
ncbi:MAG: chemotaxis protein CheW [Pseudomonadota bacterium]